MLKHHSPRDIAWWMAFDRISPIGALREDIRAATVCRWLAIGVFEKDVGPVDDFMLQYDYRGYDDDSGEESSGERRLTPEEMGSYYAALRAASIRVKAKEAARMEKMKRQRRERQAAKPKRERRVR